MKFQTGLALTREEVCDSDIKRSSCKMLPESLKTTDEADHIRIFSSDSIFRDGEKAVTEEKLVSL